MTHSWNRPQPTARTPHGELMSFIQENELDLSNMELGDEEAEVHYLPVETQQFVDVWRIIVPFHSANVCSASNLRLTIKANLSDSCLGPMNIRCQVLSQAVPGLLQINDVHVITLCNNKIGLDGLKAINLLTYRHVISEASNQHFL